MSVIAPETMIDGRYRVIDRIGAGGMADVYLAHDELLGREVAVKILHERFASDEEFVERFRREASAAAQLSHPNIVAIFDRGSWNGTYYIAMEYVPGRTLKQLIRERGPLPAEEAIEIAIQVLRAASFAHRHGVIHRDIKPHNVILGEEGRVTVTDFGIARAGNSEMTHTGSIMGTAQYLSPEQAQGAEVTAAADIYAVGVLLYELLTGVVPFEGESAVAIALQHLSSAPARIAERNPAVSPQLEAVVMRALAKSPGDRYASAEELIAALAQARSGAPAGAAAAEPPTAALLLPPEIPKQAYASGMASAEAAAANGRSTPAERAQATGGSSWRRRRTAIALVLALLAGGAIAAALLLSAPAESVSVPALAGQSQAVAVQTLRALHLVAIAEPAASTAPPGTVVSQRPAPGTTLSVGSRVYLTISTGAGTALIPKVAGLAERRALALVSAAGFKTTVARQSSPSRRVGTVISTSPPEDVEAQRGALVTLYVSSGPSSSEAPALVHVPDLIGMSEGSAEEALSAAGLATGAISSREAPGKAAGTVVAQRPAAGSAVAGGTAVALVIAAAPRQPTVPNVIGKSETAAAAALGAAGFSPVARSEAVSSPGEAGIVIEEIPPAGRRAARGSTVTIVIGTLSSTQSTTTTGTAGEAPAAHEH
ncbi:MAG TPA: Stk1 family PASTA domain-containing Ser/Thr kinase [Solirubrobacteraceae bacterium]|nr:Stk1 family PASTA domain-containing Ser/Thr kinase [Solirubrobacteraceae bacterium]